MVAYITEVAVVAKILAHLGLPTTPPPLSPARRRDHIDGSGDDIRDVVHGFDWGA